MLEDLVEHEHEFEALPGIPGQLPEGEHVLWQGAPNWRSILVQVFHIRLVAAYFGLIAIWRIVAGLHDQVTMPHLVASVVTAIVMGGVAIALFTLIAWGIGKTTIYTITNKRILMRIGIALSLTLNLPFAKITTAAVKRFGKKSQVGNLSIKTEKDNKVAYAVLWPHARPWKFASAEPALRCIDDVDGVADILATALENAQETRSLNMRSDNTVMAGPRIKQTNNDTRNRDADFGITVPAE